MNLVVCCIKAHGVQQCGVLIAWWWSTHGKYSSMLLMFVPVITELVLVRGNARCCDRYVGYTCRFANCQCVWTIQKCKIVRDLVIQNKRHQSTWVPKLWSNHLSPQGPLGLVYFFTLHFLWVCSLPLCSLPLQFTALISLSVCYVIRLPPAVANLLHPLQYADPHPSVAEARVICPTVFASLYCGTWVGQVSWTFSTSVDGSTSRTFEFF
jgi:hypothetical protein